MTGKDNYSLCAAVLNAARIKQTAYSGDMYRVSLAGVLKLDYTVAVELPPIAAHGILDKAVHMLFLDGKYPAPAYDHHRYKAERSARPSVTVEIDITQHTALLAECGEVQLAQIAAAAPAAEQQPTLAQSAQHPSAEQNHKKKKDEYQQHKNYFTPRGHDTSPPFGRSGIVYPICCGKAQSPGCRIAPIFNIQFSVGPHRAEGLTSACSRGSEQGRLR